MTFIKFTISIITYIFGFISNLLCGFYLYLLFGISVFLFPLPSFELIFPLIPFFPSFFYSFNGYLRNYNM